MAAGGIDSGSVGGGADGAVSASTGLNVATGGAVSAREGARGALVSLPMVLLALLVESCLAEPAVAVVLERWRACLALVLGLELACSVDAAVPAPLFRACCTDSFRRGVPVDGVAPSPGGRDSAFPISTLYARSCTDAAEHA